jgi:hypothetical protein
VSPFPIDYPPGATPLDPNEAEGLIPDYITTQAELNVFPLSKRPTKATTPRYCDSCEAEPRAAAARSPKH